MAGHGTCGDRPSTTDAAERFGRDLAALHATGAPAFGAAPPGGPEDAYIGLAPMRNVTGPDWPHWYAEHRVLPYLRRAVDDGTVRGPEASVIERVCERLPNWRAPPSRPPGCTATCGTATSCGAPTGTSG